MHDLQCNQFHAYLGHIFQVHTGLQLIGKLTLVKWHISVKLANQGKIKNTQQEFQKTITGTLSTHVSDNVHVIVRHASTYVCL